MNSTTIKINLQDDTRAVSSLVGFILLFAILVIAFAGYQVESVPQQNEQAEFTHLQNVEDDLTAVRSSILTAGQADMRQFSTVELGTRYPTRSIAINPPQPTGTLQTSDPYNIIIEYDGGTTEIQTRFLEYQPGYNELPSNSVWYENSVLYREGGDNPVVLEDQSLVTNGETLRITALQNELKEQGTGQITLGLYPTQDVSEEDIPDGELNVTIPTRLSGDYWDEEFQNQEDFEGEIKYEGVNSEPYLESVHALEFKINTTDDSTEFEMNTVGIQSEPEEEEGDTQKRNLGPPDDEENGEEENGGEEGSDFGDESNYRDADSGDADQPNDPSGTIENPSGVDEEDGNTATAISAGGEEDLRVGFALPPTDETASTYEMRFVIEDIQVGAGDFGFNLVNGDEQELTDRQTLEEGDNTYSFSPDEEQAISDNHDDLYLILDSDTPGAGNRSMNMDYFELISE